MTVSLQENAYLNVTDKRCFILKKGIVWGWKLTWWVCKWVTLYKRLTLVWSGIMIVQTATCVECLNAPRRPWLTCFLSMAAPPLRAWTTLTANLLYSCLYPLLTLWFWILIPDTLDTNIIKHTRFVPVAD